LRLSHSLQYCGHFIPGGRVPAAFAAFQSAPQARSRAIIAARPPVAGFSACSLAAGFGADIGFASVFAARHALLAEIAIFHAVGLVRRFHLFPLGGALFHALGLRRYGRGGESGEKYSRRNQERGFHGGNSPVPRT
jgi:hypothetical protein